MIDYMVDTLEADILFRNYNSDIEKRNMEIWVDWSMILDKMKTWDSR